MKKYLKTPEEVIKALKDGKEVKSDFSGYYKMIGGTVCHFFKNIWIINQGICSTENPYIEEAKPLKLEVGKFYKNRAGRKHICCFIEKDQDDVYAIKFVDLESGDIIITEPTGRYLTTKETEDDIIGEWED